jgi:hypothetical protein
MPEFYSLNRCSCTDNRYVQLDALFHGRAFLEDADAGQIAERDLRALLDRHWSERHQVYTAAWSATADVSDGLIDSAQLLAVLDAGLPEGINTDSARVILVSRKHRQTTLKPYRGPGASSCRRSLNIRMLS